MVRGWVQPFWISLLPRACLFSTSSEPTTSECLAQFKWHHKIFSSSVEVGSLQEALVAGVYIKGVTQKCNAVYVYTRCEITRPCSQMPNSSIQQSKILHECFRVAASREHQPRLPAPEAPWQLSAPAELGPPLALPAFLETESWIQPTAFKSA